MSAASAVAQPRKRPDLAGPRQKKGCDRLVIRIKSRGNESIDQMLRRFKKLCEKEGLIKDVKRMSYYEKPSEKARRKDRKSLKRAQQESLEQQGRLKA
jgi:small subunit ribosomal protein S21